MPTKKCPVCGVAVKLENLERHLRDKHPRSGVDPGSIFTDEERQAAARVQHAAATPRITRKGVRLIAIVAASIAAILVLVILNPFGNVGPGIGQIAPDFSIRNTSGTTVSLSSYRGSVVLVEFMDIDCPACQAELPTLVSLYANYSSVRFLSINVQFVGNPETDAEVAAWAVNGGATWSYAVDFSGSVQSRYGITGTPTSFVVDPNGLIRAIVRPTGAGGNTYADFANAFDLASGA